MLLDSKAAEEDELDEEYRVQRERQKNFFDYDVNVEFEIERPHGTPALYSWYYEEKFRRSIAGLERLLPGSTVLTVCGGSGMDAEFLASQGVRVIASDSSLGATRRVRERARRYNLPIEPVVADVERLPFSDCSVDIAYVHDGLHHLIDPFAGMAQMTRVARLAVSITEPADAVATKLAIRLGLSIEWEEAGNRVARMKEAEVLRFLEDRAFNIASLERYVMYYKHHPGRLIAFLSKPMIFALSKATVRFGNLLVGRWGNRLGITAIRRVV
jgi:ubiquinone/menaquinone biosynthesis C-methylase UbiE